MHVFDRCRAFGVQRKYNLKYKIFDVLFEPGVKNNENWNLMFLFVYQMSGSHALYTKVKNVVISLELD